MLKIFGGILAAIVIFAAGGVTSLVVYDLRDSGESVASDGLANPSLCDDALARRRDAEATLARQYVDPAGATGAERSRARLAFSRERDEARRRKEQADADIQREC